MKLDFVFELETLLPPLCSSAGDLGDVKEKLQLELKWLHVNLLVLNLKQNKYRTSLFWRQNHDVTVA